MATSIQGRKIAFLVSDGVEELELVVPWEALRDAGAQPVLVSPVTGGSIEAVHNEERASSVPVDLTLAQARAGEFDALVLPGGAGSAERLRSDGNALAFSRAFMEADKPVAAIGNGSSLLVEADVVRGRSLTSSPDLKDAVENAGGEWVDRPVHTDQKLVTCRTQEHLAPFCAKLLALFESAIEERRLDRMVEQTFPASDPLPGPSTIGGRKAPDDDEGESLVEGR